MTALYVYVVIFGLGALGYLATIKALIGRDNTQEERIKALEKHIARLDALVSKGNELDGEILQIIQRATGDWYSGA